MYELKLASYVLNYAMAVKIIYNELQRTVNPHKKSGWEKKKERQELQRERRSPSYFLCAY